MAKKIDPTPTITAAEFKKLLDVDAPRYVIWDIETVAMPDDHLRSCVDERKIKLPEHPGAFDPTKIKYGNRTDAKKRQDWAAECRRKHNVALAEHEEKCRQAREDYFEKFKGESTLNPALSHIAAIGYGVLMSDGSVQIFLDVEDEAAITERIWYVLNRVVATDGKWYTWNGHGFDLQFVKAKGWVHDVPMFDFRTQYNKFIGASVDACEVFTQGRYGSRSKLDHVAKMFKVGSKLKGVTGDQFGKLLTLGTAAARRDALTYLWTDIDVTYRVCAKMGLLDIPLKILQERAREVANESSTD